MALHIGFGHHTVTVEPNTPDVEEHVRREFRFLLRDQPGETLGHVVPPARPAPLRDTLLTIRYAVIQRFMDARDDLVWFHGAAASRGERAIALPGPRGRGKSTIVAALCARGWRFVSDDALPIDPRRTTVAPFPQVPAYREHPGEAMPEAWLETAPKQPIPLVDAQVVRVPLPLVGFVFPHHDPDSAAALTPRDPAPTALAMLAGCWDVPRHRERAVEVVATLAGAIPAWDLRFAEGAEAAELLEEVVPETPQT